MKTCTKCKRELPLTDFAKQVRRAETHYSQCKSCKAEYRNTDEHKAKEKERSKNRRDTATPEDKAKRKCWRSIYYRTSIGEVERPGVCEVCGKHETTQSHHPDYSKPLEVVGCCRDCHNQLDNERRKSA
jgi:hypothetical protein